MAYSLNNDLIDYISDLKKIDASSVDLSEIRIKCKHITTCADGCKSIKELPV